MSEKRVHELTDDALVAALKRARADGGSTDVYIGYLDAHGHDEVALYYDATLTDGLLVRRSAIRRAMQLDDGRHSLTALWIDKSATPPPRRIGKAAAGAADPIQDWQQRSA